MAVKEKRNFLCWLTTRQAQLRLQPDGLAARRPNEKIEREISQEEHICSSSPPLIVATTLLLLLLLCV